MTTEYLTTNFTRDELACRCGCGFLPTTRSIIRLQDLRDLLGTPMTINSGARCKHHNQRVGGEPDSCHIDGIAFDIKCPNSFYRHRLLKAVFAQGYIGIGIAETFVHIDDRPIGKGRALVWMYGAKQPTFSDH